MAIKNTRTIDMFSDEKLRILIIDDNLAIHHDFKAILSCKKKNDEILDEMDEKLFGENHHENVALLPQFEIDSAMQGEEGCELIRAALQQNKPYALAFIDIRMPPGIDGIETIKKILTMDQKIQLVICTAYYDYSWQKIIEKLTQYKNILIFKKPFDHLEVRQLAIALTQKWQRSRAALQNSPMFEKQVKNSAETGKFEKQEDLLTRLPSKAFFDYFLEEAIHYAEHNMFLFSVLRIDIDKITVVNATHVLSAKNELSSQLFDRISKQLRHRDLLTQLSEGKFGVVLMNFNFSQDVRRTAERILTAFKEPFMVEANQISVLVSIGVSFFPIDAKFPDDLVHKAEAAMLGAKKMGGNLHQFYSPELAHDNTISSKFETEMHNAIQNNEFFLLYQPQYDLAENKMTSLEVFLRWNHPERGVLAPIDFISSSENVGVFVILGCWVIKEVCRQSVAWKKNGLSTHPIAINITPHQFQQFDLVKKIADIFTETGVDPQSIEFEITDNIFEMYADAKNKISQLKALGVSIVLDNFGTHYSSVGPLKDNYFSKLKIDKSFMRNIHKSTADEIIIQAIIKMASGMHINVVASGIENQEQLAFLKENGCQLGQGFYLSEPLTVMELEKRLLT